MRYSFSESSSEYLPNQLFLSNKEHYQRFSYDGLNRSFNRYNYQGNNTYQ
jgi:hypothetical protein